MEDFLQYLNSASSADLARTPGITAALAEGILAARPFSAPEDCLKVRGMGRGLLARLQSSFENQPQPAAPADPLPALPEPGPAPEPSAPEPAPSGPSFWARLGKAFLDFVRALFRLVAILLIVGAIGAGFYYGIPFVNDNLLVPIQRHTSQIENLESQLADLKQQVADLKKQNQELEDGLPKVESMQSEQAKRIDQLAEQQKTLEAQASEQNNVVLTELERQVRLTRAIEILGRARLFLSQSNFGLARADVQSARDLLDELVPDAPAGQQADLWQVVARLDLALGNLPGFPVIAAGDLDIAWQMLMDGYSTSTPTPTPAP